MADRKAIQLQDGLGNLYDIKDAEARENIDLLQSALNFDKAATPGYIMTATNNGTGQQWSPVGLPTDEQTGEAVSAWLDDHPEATTTVEDGSLTEAKFTDDALQSIKSRTYTIDISKFGGYSDGTHAAETEEAINDALVWAKENGYDKVYMPDGTYLIVGYEYNSYYRFKNCGITPPSNIQITLAPNAVIKIQPNLSPTYCAIFASKKDNIIIEGGKIVGDRPDHDYTTVTSTHEQGFGVVFYGCHNCIIRNTEIYDFTGDCIALTSEGFAPNPDYDPSLNTRIINCNIYNTRRNGISIGGTKNTLVDGCHIHDIGTEINGVDGTAPMCGIDIEGYMDAGVITDDPYNVTVVNSYFDRNGCDINMYTAHKSIISNNHFETGVDCSFAYQSILSNNTFYCSDTENNRRGISFQNSRSVFNNQSNVIVEGNLVSGFSTGIFVVGDNIDVKNNTIVNFTAEGVYLYASGSTTSKVSFSNNTIIGTGVGTGIRLNGQENISIDGNKVYNAEIPIVFYLANQSGISISNNLFDTFTGVLMNVNYRADGANKFLFANNIIRNAVFNNAKYGGYGLISVDESLDVDIINNTFEDISNYDWIISIENNRNSPRIGKFNITGNIIKNVAQYHAIISRSQHAPQIMIANNIMHLSSKNLPAIYIPYDADKSCSGIIGNYIIPYDNTVVLPVAIKTTGNGVGLIAKNIVMIGTIDAVGTDTLVDNYVKANASS